MKSVSKKSKILTVLALLLALCGSLVLAFFDGGQKTIEQKTVALAGPENTDKFWTDDGIRGTHFSGGAGTEASPYLIGSAEELAFLAYQVNENGQTFAGKYFALTADVDLSAYYWRPIGLEYDSTGQNLTRPFQGSFSGSYDGVQHTISGLYTQPVPEGLTDATALRAYDNQGLFGYIYGSDASIKVTIKDVHIEDSVIQGNNHVAAVAGRINPINNAGPYTVENCTSKATILASGNAAGIVANSRVTMTSNCTNNGPVTSTSGSAYGVCYGDATDCVNNGKINASSSAYGVCGSDATNCTNNGPVTSTSRSAYGVCGGDATNCVNNASGIVTSAGNGAGICNYGPARGCVNYADIYCYGENAGGILITGSVTECVNYGDIYCEPKTESGSQTQTGVGGLAAIKSNVTRSANYGNITGGFHIGGLVGGLMPGPSSGHYKISASYNMGLLNAKESTKYVGGLVGCLGTWNDFSVILSNCYNAGDIYAEQAVAGGLVGTLRGGVYYETGSVSSMTNCFNVGQIYDGSQAYGIGFVEDTSVPISNCYYNNTDSQGQPLPAGGNGTYLAALDSLAKTQVFFEDESYWSASSMWDFRFTWTINPSVNDGYPSFNQSTALYWTNDSIRANSFAGGSGTQEDPYLIETAEQLAYLAYMVNSGSADMELGIEFANDIYIEHYYQDTYFKQTKDIDLSQYIWPGIGLYGYDENYQAAVRTFSGSYDGGGHKITGMYAANENYSAGLFGLVATNVVKFMGTMNPADAKSATIKGITLVEPTVTPVNPDEFLGGGIIGALMYAVNLTISDCHIQGGVISGSQGAASGGIVGMAAAFYSTIQNCTNSATVAGGGIVGSIETDPSLAGLSIINCTNNGSVCGGGIVAEGVGLDISDCVNNGAVSRLNESIGGIVGFVSSGNVSNCINNGKIEGVASNVGGIVGLVEYQTRIVGCQNNGEISVSANYVGGILGEVDYTQSSNDKATIMHCSNSGNILNSYNITGSSSSNCTYTGGIVGGIGFGFSDIIVSDCYNRGDVTSLSENSASYTAGVNTGVNQNSATNKVTNCYNTGTITAASNVGGIIAQGIATDSFNLGNVVYTGSSDVYVGAIAADRYNLSITNCYWGGECPQTLLPAGDGTVSGASYVENLDSLAKTEEWFTNADNWSSVWDFVGTWGFEEGQNDGYPVLIELDWWINQENVAENFAGGSGTKQDPYLIETAEQLALLSYNVYNGSGFMYSGQYFKQTANIDLQGHLWFPIGALCGIYGEEMQVFFSGNYNGDGYYITGMTFLPDINLSNPIGLPCSVFGQLYSNGASQVIENVVSGLPNAEGDQQWTVRGAGYVAGIVGILLSDGITVRNCTNWANIESTSQGTTTNVAGIVSYSGGGQIVDCTNYGNVTAIDCEVVAGVAGGIAPYGAGVLASGCVNYGDVNAGAASEYVGGIASDGIISKSFNYGSVSGGESVGGLVGYGTASESANYGTVSGMTSVGGVVGYLRAASGNLSDCFNAGDVVGLDGSQNVGGVAGLLPSVSTSSLGNVQNVYSRGSVSGTTNVGGLFGIVTKPSSTSYSTINIDVAFVIGSVSGTTNVGAITGNGKVGDYTYFGGQIPSSMQPSGTETVSDSRYIADLENLAKNLDFYQDSQRWGAGFAIWDFAGIWGFKTGENDGYPVFIQVEKWSDIGNYATSYAGGSGTKEDPYLIETAEQLAYLAYMVNSGSADSIQSEAILSGLKLRYYYSGFYFKQIADIDLSAYYWIPIANPVDQNNLYNIIFGGNYDGGGFKISGLKTLGGGKALYMESGLFGSIGGASTPCEIKNVNLVNADVKGWMAAGGIAAIVMNQGVSSESSSVTPGVTTIENCNISANVSNNISQLCSVGGVVGYIMNGFGTVNIRNCSVAGSINIENSLEESTAGGVIGRSNASVVIENVIVSADIAVADKNAGAVFGSLAVNNEKTTSVSISNTLISAKLSGSASVGILSAKLDIMSNATANAVTIDNCGFEIAAENAGVLTFCGSNADEDVIISDYVSATGIYLLANLADGAEMDLSQEKNVFDNALFTLNKSSGTERFYVGTDFSNFVWLEGSPTPVMADFVWVGQELLSTYTEGYMTNLITSQWQAL